ncbi:MAG TPA: hypothetical protein VGX28_13080 [Frankiaceae bacterium]|nr:hypothetical protein [Frankiaceae bacterium]
MAAPAAVVPSRAAEPCHYPDDMADLDARRRGADAVAVVTLASRHGEPAGDDVVWHARVERVLDGAAPADVTIVERVGDVDGFFRDTRYVVFLFARRGTSFVVLDGVEGMLPVREGRVYAECYGSDPATRPSGAGVHAGEPLEAFVARYAAHAGGAASP